MVPEMLSVNGFTDVAIFSISGLSDSFILAAYSCDVSKSAFMNLSFISSIPFNSLYFFSNISSDSTHKPIYCAKKRLPSLFISADVYTPFECEAII